VRRSSQLSLRNIVKLNGERTHCGGSKAARQVIED
jgi:hypothetical protein